MVSWLVAWLLVEKKGGLFMTDIYTKQLIDLLNDKIKRLEQEKDSQRKEINRLKKELLGYKKAV